MSSRALVVLLAGAVGLIGCGDGHDSGAQRIAFVTGSVDVVPRPADVKVDRDGSVFVFDDQTAVVVARDEPTARGAADLLVALLRGPFPGHPDSAEAPRGPPRRDAVLLTLSGAAALGRDGYELEVTPHHVLVRAAAPAGLVHGVQTLRQLLPPEIEQRAPVPGVVWSVPSVQIRDVPRFGWRGLLIDTSRTFFPKEFLLRQLELMALYKLSVLHLHLTDDQGWRLEIESHPELHELGSQWDAQRAPNERSGYYTKADIREIVDRATALGIEVLPEIDMPGHIVAALHALPELACRTAPDQPRSADEFPIVPATERPFPKNILCVCDERVYEVMQAVLDEVIALFPNAFVHVGGDEVVRRDEWEQGYLCRDLIERGVVESTDHLQGYFQKRIEDFLRSRGRRMIAWDEALVHEQPDTPSEQLSSWASFMFWRDFLRPPARLYERDVVAAPFTRLYLDYKTAIDRVYEFDPVPEGLTREQAAHVLGAEGAMWTGAPDARSEQGAERHMFPRVLAIAELTWTPRALRDGNDFARRLGRETGRLEMLGIPLGP